MATQTNIALNSRFMSGVITLSDGIATLENGELNCSNINSNSLTATTANINNITVPTINGDNLNNCTLTNCNVSADPIIPLGVASKNYVDSNISSGLTNVAYINATQTFTAQNTFNNYCPQTSIAPTLSSSITNKDYVDNASHTLAGYAKLVNNQIFTGSNVFNGFCPIATVAPTLSTSLTNKDYVDNGSHTLAGYAKLASSNIFTLVNQFNAGINIGNSSGTNATIQATLASALISLFTNATGILLFGSSLNALVWRWNEFYEIFKTKNITSNYTIVFPLQETYVIRTTTADLTINLPIITSVNIGIKITIVKTVANYSVHTLVAGT